METRQEYNQAKGAAKRAIFKAKNDRKKFHEDLEKVDQKGNVFRVAKQLVNKNRCGNKLCEGQWWEDCSGGR